MKCLMEVLTNKKSFWLTFHQNKTLLATNKYSAYMKNINPSPFFIYCWE